MGIVIDFLMGDYTGCVGDAVTGQRLCVPFIAFKTEYRSCKSNHWRRWWQRFIWRIVRCHTLRSWHHRHRHFHWQRLPCHRQYLTFSCTFRVTYYKRSSRVCHPQWSCRYRFTNRTRVFFWHCRRYWFCHWCHWDTTVSDIPSYCCRVYTPSESLQHWTGALSIQ